MTCWEPTVWCYMCPGRSAKIELSCWKSNSSFEFQGTFELIWLFWCVEDDLCFYLRWNKEALSVLICWCEIKAETSLLLHVGLTELDCWIAGVAGNTSNHQPSSLRRTQPCGGGWVQYGIRPFWLLLDQMWLRRKHSFGCWRRLVKLCNIQKEGQPCKCNGLTSWCCAALRLALILLGSELRGSSALAGATATPFYCGIILPLKKKPEALVHLGFCPVSDQKRSNWSNLATTSSDLATEPTSGINPCQGISWIWTFFMEFSWLLKNSHFGINNFIVGLRETVDSSLWRKYPNKNNV